MSNFSKLLQQASAGNTKKMALPSFIMSLEAGYHINAWFKLEDGRYVGVSAFDSARVSDTSATYIVPDCDYDLFMLDSGTGDGGISFRRSVFTIAGTVDEKTNLSDRFLENRLFQGGYLCFDRQYFGPLSNTRVPRVSQGYFAENNLFPSDGEGYFYENGTSTLGGQTLNLAPKLTTPSYDIYAGRFINTSNASKTQFQVEVYLKGTSTLVCEFGLYRPSNNVSAFVIVKELSNGNLLFVNDGNGIIEVSTSGTKVWNHIGRSSQPMADWQEDPTSNFLYGYANNTLHRINRSNGAWAYTTTSFTGTNYTESNFETAVGSADFSSRLSIDTDGTLYLGNYANKVFGINKIESDTITTFWDFYDNDNYCTHSILNSCILTEGKLLFSGALGSRVGYPKLAFIGAIDKTTTGTQTFNLYTQGTTKTHKEFSIETKTANVPLVWNGQTDSSDKVEITTAFNGSGIKSTYETNSVEVSTNSNDAGSSLAYLA